MAELLLNASVDFIIHKVASVANENISLLAGFNSDLQRLKRSIPIIQSLLLDSERQQTEREATKHWLRKLEELAYDADTVLDELNYENLRQRIEVGDQLKRKVRYFFSLSNPIIFRWKMAQRIRDINVNLKLINEEANDFGVNKLGGADTSPSVSRVPSSRMETDSISDPKVRARPNEALEVVRVVTRPTNEVLSTYAITGMAGLGKTALAKSIYNDSTIKSHFDSTIWVFVGENFEVTRILHLILESLTQKQNVVLSRDALVKMVKRELEVKRYLLVLDDVWNEDPSGWDDFIATLIGINPMSGNWIIVTTRKQGVALLVQPHPPLTRSLEGLSDDDCWSILKDKAFANGVVLSKEMEAIGKEVAKKCQGLPLAANLVGGILRGKGVDEWRLIQESFSNVVCGENTTLQLLGFSFNQLPSASLKKCFAYCSIFAKGSELEREQVVQLWMAEGYLEPNKKIDMEDMGNTFFNLLLQSSLFQDVKKDVYNNVICCKMHDLVHEALCHVSSSEIKRMDDTTLDSMPQVHHLALNSCKVKRKKTNEENAKYVRTLFLKGIAYDQMFQVFRSLHVLNLDGAGIEALPISIGILLHLRLVNISHTKVKSLPHSICKLYNLQTLRTTGCDSLRELPNKMRNLISLRHLHYYKDEKIKMPLRIGELTSLRTLEFFNVSPERGRGIEELGSLKNLGGKLEIRNLEHVHSEEEAKRADLSGKKNMRELEFLWSDDWESDCNIGGVVLEGLQPHPSLKVLTVKNFMDEFPPWVRRISSLGFDHLVQIKFLGCKRCTEIPSLGQLPNLQYLELNGFDSVTHIGPSFYFTDNHSESSSGGNDNHGRALYPALKSLTLEDMPNLLEWMDARVMLSVSTADFDVAVFPNLKKLTINGCPQLKSAPRHFPCLKQLSMSNIESGLPLGQICSNRLTTLKSFEIRLMHELTSIPHQILYNNQSLATLTISSCHRLEHIAENLSCCSPCLRKLEIINCGKLTMLPEGLYSLKSFENLTISQCPNLTSLPSVHEDVEAFASLRSLYITHCDGLTVIPSKILCHCKNLELLAVSQCSNLISFPVEELQQLGCLTLLFISRCPKLTSLPKGLGCLTKLRELCFGPFSDGVDFDAFQASLHGLEQLQSLHSVELCGWLHWNSLPSQLQHLTAMQELSIHGFGVEALPDWFGYLRSLKYLGFYNCQKLQQLPSKEAMQCLTDLVDLTIYDCPPLEERCKSRSRMDSEFYKISHIEGLYTTQGKLNKLKSE